MKVCSVCQRCYKDSAVSCTEENHPPLSEVRRGSPEIIAGYRLEFLLESGGKSEIYRARQTASGQSCLIKILSADEKISQQFLYEAKLAAALVHPNVAEVYEAGVLKNGESFVVMEEADGQTLRELLNNSGVPPLLTAIQVARQAAEALYAVHLQGLTHRAVNPENIILTTDGERRLLVKIQNLDFGGVSEQYIVSSRFLSESGLYALKYFAPEQCAGETVSAQTDVYGLGIVFYEMLAGVPPFDAPKAALLIEKHRHEPPPAVKINNFDLRMLVTHTLTESLRKQPKMRHSSANVAARQLRHIEQLATHISTPPPALIVPPAPQKSVAAAAVAPAKPLTIQPKETFRENSESIAGKIENEPIPVKIENEPVVTLKVENEPARAFEVTNKPATVFKTESESIIAFNFEDEPVIKTESEPVPIINLENSILDLPEIEETTELLSAEPVIASFIEEKIVPVQTTQPAAEIRVVQSDLEEIKVISVECEPTLIEGEQPREDIPSEAEILEIQLQEQLIDPVSAPVATEFAANDFSSEENFLPDDDFSVLPDEIELQPAFLNKAGKTESFDPRDSIFSSYGGQSKARFPVEYRPLFFGGGFIGLLVLFFVGYALVSGRLYRESLSEPVTAQSAPAQKSLPQQFEPTPTRQKSLKNPEIASPAEDDANINQLKPLPINERPPLSREKSPASAVKTGVPNQVPKTSETNRNAAKPPVFNKDGTPRLPSTVVIFPEGGKIKSKVEPEKKSVAKKPSTISKQSDDFIRPRIVKNPKP